MTKAINAITVKAKSLLAVPDSFIETAREFPGKVDQALALLNDVAAVNDLLAKADTMEHYAKRIKLDKETITCIQYGRMKIVAKLGELMVRGQKGRGKKKQSVYPTIFHRETIAAYRKVADHADKLDEYRSEVEAEEEAEMSISGFIRYVASDGNLKAHQNKGVIEWYTPAEYIEAARDVMGKIDLDPASNAKAQKIVQAGTFYSKQDDGLAKMWKGTVFLNPPFKADLIKAFIAKLCQSYADGDVTQAIVLTNNSTDTGWWHQAAEASTVICFTKGRVPFYSPAGETAAPTNGHTFFYMGKRRGAFIRSFSQFGYLMEGAKA